MKYFPKISRGNIYLSPINAEDFEIVTKWMNDPRITNGTHGSPRMITLKKEKEYIEGLPYDGQYEFAIVRKDDDTLLGLTGLFRINHINQTAELGISIGEVDEHNKGYGADAVNALLSYAYNTLNLYNISLWVKSFNKKAIVCYKKVGFKETGIKHHSEYCEGERYDNILMEILKPDWQEKNKDILSYDL